MRRYATTIWATLGAIAVLAALTTAASAGRLSTSENRFRAVWTPLTFSTTAEGSGVTIRCNLTIEGSFHYRSLIKATRSLIGYVTKAFMSHPCTGAEAWAMNGSESVLGGTVGNALPWHISYEAFEGTLPAITGVRYLVAPAFLVNVIGILCQFGGNTQGVISLTRGVGARMLPDGTIGVTRTSGGIFCGSEGFFSLEVGAGSTVTVLGAETRITITLI